MTESTTPWHSSHWITEGKPDGGISTGLGFTIAWQRGALSEQGRNGAFLTEVLEACLEELEHKHSQFPCAENEEALTALQEVLDALQRRLDRRKQEGTLYEHSETPYPRS